MVRFEVSLGSSRARQLQQTVSDEIAASCSVILVGALGVDVSEIALNSFRVTVTVDPTSAVSANDIIDIVYDPNFVIRLSSLINPERTIRLVSVEIADASGWRHIPSPPVRPPPPSSNPSSYSRPESPSPSAAPIWSLITMGVIGVFAAALIIVAVILWNRTRVGQFIVTQPPAVVQVPQNVAGTQSTTR